MTMAQWQSLRPLEEVSRGGQILPIPKIGL